MLVQKFDSVIMEMSIILAVLESSTLVHKLGNDPIDGSLVTLFDVALIDQTGHKAEFSFSEVCIETFGPLLLTQRISGIFDIVKVLITIDDILVELFHEPHECGPYLFERIERHELLCLQ